MLKAEQGENQIEASEIKAQSSIISGTKATMSVGNLEPFNVARPESWSAYYARFELFLLANDVQGNERQKATFLTLAGAPLFDLLASLAAPKQVSQLTLAEIKKFLTDHFSPPPSEIAAYYNFHRRDQQPNESFSDYVACLRKLAVDCNFGAALDRMLRDRIVCGLRDEALQRNLLAESDLHLQKVIDRATVAETASRNALSMRHAEQVHHISAKNSNKNSRQHQQRTKKQNSRSQLQAPFCNGCGGQHARCKCPHKETICSACGIKGHLQRVCRSTESISTQAKSSSTPHRPRKWQPQVVNQVLPLTDLKKTATIVINGRPCRFEIDSGSNFTIMSSEVFEYVWPTAKPALNKCDLRLMDFQRNLIPIKGVVDVNVTHNGQIITGLPVVIVDGHRTNVLGCNWFQPLGISIQGVDTIGDASSIQSVLTKFEHLFSNELGTFTGNPVSLEIDPTIQPIRYPPRRIPLAIRGLVEAELDRLCKQGILEPVEYSDWATPIVAVPKSDGTIRICGDYKSTLNKALKPHNFQIPAISTLLSSIEGGSIFAKLDLAQAYQQLLVDEKSSLLQTIVTHKGAFRVTRLQFGISSAPGIFQSFIENILRNIQGVLPYFDDIVLMGKTEADFADNLEQVLTRFDKSGLRLRKDKCKFGVPTIELGFKLDALGIRPSPGKLEAIRSAPAPTEKKQLQAFLGLLNFYHVFLPHKATIAEPLHRLLDKDAVWNWSTIHQQAFDTLKDMVLSERVLVHYNPELPLMVICDASPYGIGAVISHKLPNGDERPIAFYSRTLSRAERNYAQIDKEAVAIVAGIKKFHDYLFGRRFTIVTDRRPLLGIFNTSKPVPVVISNQMLRRRIFLNAYDFDIIYRPGTKLGNADCLSRLPVDTGNLQIMDEEEEVLMIEMVSKPIVDAKEIASRTENNFELSKVLSWALRGWPQALDHSDNLYPYYVRRNEITTLKGCLLWGNRVVIPPTCRQVILDALHTGHPGIVRMKALARSYVWWPGMDADIERTVRQCIPCQQTRHENPHAPVHAWESTQEPWSRLHIDFAGPVRGKFFFIVVDSYSKWLEVFVVPSTSSYSAIKPLRSLFATHGLPDSIVSDNGTSFTSEEFKSFMQNNLIRHIRCAPFHPSSNGQAERMVQTTKDFLKKSGDRSNLEKELARFLFTQHITPHSSTNRSPAELLFNRQLKTFFDKLHPHELRVHAPEKQPVKTFDVGDSVWIRNYSSGPRWVEAKIESRTGPISYTARLPDSRIIRRHLDQIKGRSTTECPIPTTDLSPPDLQISSDQEQPKEPESGESEEPGEPEEHESAILRNDRNSPGLTRPEFCSMAPEPISVLDEKEVTPRRSTRTKRPPQFYVPTGR